MFGIPALIGCVFKCLMLVGRLDSLRCQEKGSPAITSFFSDPIYAFTAGQFPGATEPLPIMQCFRNQGVHIPIARNRSG